MKTGAHLQEAHERLQAQVDELTRVNAQLRHDLAAQKIDSQALRDNALRSLSEISGDGYWEQDAQHRFVVFAKDVSPERSSDEVADDAAGKCRWELTGSVPISSSWEAHRAVLDAHQPFRGFEYQRTLSGGATSYFSVSGVPVFDSQHNFMGYRGTARDVSAIRRAEASQREAFAFLGEIVDNIPIAFHLKSAESPFPVLVWNKAAQTLYGISREEAVGRCVPDLWPGESAERLHASDLELVRLGMVQDFPNRVIRTRNRGPRHVHMRKAALKNASGAVTHILVTAEDVTESHAAEARLRESEQRFRSLIQLSSDWYWETDDCFRMTELSGGDTEDERQWLISPLGKTRWEGDASAANAQLWAEHRAVLLRHETFRDFEYQREDRTGRWRSVCISGEPVYNANGDFVGYRGVGSDITTRKMIETALRTSETRFRAVVAALAEGVVLRDAEGRITDCNASAERILGLTRAQMMGHGSTHWQWERLHEDGSPLAAEDIPSAVAGRTGLAQSEVVGYRKPGGDVLWTSINVQPMFEGESKLPTGFVTTITDISKRKRDEMEIVRLNVGLEKRVLRRTAELEAANRELEAFSYSVAHDLRSPLSAIDGFSALLQKALLEGSAERAQHCLERIRAGVQRMGRLADGLLGLVKLSRTQLHWEGVDLSAEAERLLQKHAEHDTGRQVKIRVEPGMRVQADSTLLRQVLEHLISNAWKFSAKKNPAEITLGSQTDSDQQTVYFVRDNGAGFDMAYADKLFGTFQRLHAPEEFAGSGIGLATVNRIISRHGGRIWAHAKVGEGCTFYFTIGEEQAQLDGAEDVAFAPAGLLGSRLPEAQGLATGEAANKSDMLKLSDHQFSNAFEHSAIGMALIAVDARRLRINSAFCQLLGYSEAEMLMRSNHDLTHPDDIDYDMLQRKRALAGEIESYQCEKRYIHKSGRIIWVHLSCSLLRDDDRRPLMFISLVQDITERRHVEAVLRESEERFRALSELSSDWFWEQDENFRFVQISGRTIELEQETPNPILGKTRWELDDVVMAPGGWEQHKAQLERHETFREFEIVRQDNQGRLYYESISGTPIFVAGRFAGYHGTGRDTTAMRQIQDALLASESQLRDITDTISARIAYVDAGQVYRFHNRTYREGLGLAPGEVNGRTLREVLGDKNYETTYPWLQEVLAGYPVVFEQQRPTPQGEMRDFVVNYLPRYGDGGDEDTVLGFYLFANDVTEFKRIDRMKSEFVSTVSHELRTPLTSIRGSLGLISGGVAGPLPDAAKSLVAIASSNCERLIRLINDILDIEKIESGKMNLDVQPVELGPLLAEVLAANQHYGQTQQAALELVLPEDALTVQADRDRLVQVVTNLLSNAMKFSPAGVAVEVQLMRAGPRVRVEVRDRGPGIPAEFRSRIFQKFSQADASDTRQKGGTGLGLSISRAIIERFGGHIGFESELGQGTTFFFELPEWRAPATGAMTLPSVDEALDAQRPCVLVCEDDGDIARLLALMLDKGGFDADLSYSAEQAQAQLALRNYAAMTVDLKLPDADGLSLILNLRSQPATRELPILVVSASAAEGQLSLNNQSLSVSEWLEKPIDENLLILGLRRAIAGVSGKPRILHVEDDLDIQRVTAVIAQDFATFEFATNLADARIWLRQQYFDLVLLDLALGEGSGWDLLDDIEALSMPVPVVVFSASEVERPHSPRVAAVLLKGQTSNSELLQTLQRTLRHAKSPQP